jgi:hypothetical protein
MKNVKKKKKSVPLFTFNKHDMNLSINLKISIQHKEAWHLIGTSHALGL